MSVLFSGTNQGRFTADGSAKIIQLRSDLDWLWVKNETVSYAAGAGTGAEFYWQRGMAQGRGTIYTKTAVTNALAVAQIAANSGFYLVDSSVNLPSASVALTGIDAGTPPTVFTGDTSLLNELDMVRIYSTVGALQLQGLDFTIDNINPNNSFDLAYMAPIANANPGAGTWRRIPYDPIYYPRRRYITKISRAAQAIVTLSVTHGFTVGQEVRLVVPFVRGQAGASPAVFGMTELDGVSATIVAVGAPDADGVTNTITIDVDTSGYTAFSFPLTADGVFTPAQVVPIGENTAQALDSGVSILGDATVNTGYIGVRLEAGTSSPAGADNDVIYWVAGKSFSVDNQ
jgi:hypothetical protein